MPYALGKSEKKKKKKKKNETNSHMIMMMHQYAIVVATNHYENTPIQIYSKFHLQKLKIFRWKNSDIFHISAQNIDCGHSFWAKIRKIMYTPVNPSFTI